MYNQSFRPNVLPTLATEERKSAIGFGDVLRFLRSAFPVVAASVAVFVALAIIFCMVVKPSFTSNGQILIEPNQASAVLMESARSSGMVESEAGRIESQIQVLKTSRITEAVIQKLDLLDDPEFALPQPKPPFYAPLLAALGKEKPAPQDLSGARMTYAVDAFAGRVAVRRVGQSSVLDIQFSSTDPAKASRILDALLEAYINADISAKADNARRASQWLNERLDELRDQMSESRGALERFKATSDLQNAADRTVKFAQLESMAQTQSRLYDAFLMRSLETVQKITYPVPDARIIGTATKPQSRSFPKVSLTVAFAGLIGAALGVGISMIMRSADQRIQSVRNVTDSTHIPVLGTVAAAPGRRSVRRGGASQFLQDAARIKAIGLDQRVANDLRALKVTVNAALLARPMKRIGITSPGRNEGTTTVAFHLSRLLASSGMRVLLVDLCSDDRTLSRSLAPEARFGVSDYLGNPSILPQAVVPYGADKNLYLLPYGNAETPVSPAEMFAAKQHLAELDVLNQTFDLIVFDLPGTEESPDAFALAPLLNAMVLVVEHKRSTLPDLTASLESLRVARTEVLGIVINKAT